MGDWFEDTDPQALEVWLERQRSMTPGEKLAAVFQLSALVDALAREGARRMYPEADEREIFLRVTARKLGRETMIRAYGWDPQTGRNVDA